MPLGCKALLIDVYTDVYSVRYGWDQSKSAANLRERHFDFAFATLVFEAPRLEREDTRRDYGERRMIAIGVADGVELTVVYTDRITPNGETERRIISARRSNRREREAYQRALGG